MSDQYNVGNSMIRAGQQALRVSGTLYEAETQAMVNENIHKFDILNTEINAAIQLRDIDALKTAAAPFASMDLDRDKMKSYTQQLVQNQIGSSQDAATTLSTMDEAYAMSDESIGEFAQGYSQVMYAAKDALLSQTRGRGARRQLEATLDAKIARGFSAFTKQAVEWKIQDTKLRSQSVAEHAIIAQPAGSEEDPRGGLEDTNDEIERAINSNPYWSEIEKETLVETYQHQALVDWANKGVNQAYSQSSFVVTEDGVEVMGADKEQLIDPYVAKATAIDWLYENSEGLTLQELGIMEQKISTKAAQDWTMELKRRDAYDTAREQEMTDAYARGLMRGENPLTNEMVARDQWFNPALEMKWYARSEEIEDMANAGGGLSQTEQEEWWKGTLRGIVFDATSVEEANKLLFEHPEFSAAREADPRLNNVLAAVLDDVPDRIAMNVNVNPTVISAGASIIEAGIPDNKFAQAAAKFELQEAINNAELTGKALGPDDVERISQTLVTQYEHTKDYIIDASGAIIRANTRRMGAFGFEGGRDAARTSYYEEIGTLVAENKFASWLFFDNNEVDYDRLDTWIRSVGADQKSNSIGYELKDIIKTYYEGPADAVGSLGDGRSSYERIQMIGKDVPIPVHTVINSVGDEEMYLVITTPQDASGVPAEALGTEGWYRVFEDENGGWTQGPFAGTVKTGTRLQEEADALQSQKDKNEGNGYGAVSDHERNQIRVIEREVAALRAEQLREEAEALHGEIQRPGASTGATEAGARIIDGAKRLGRWLEERWLPIPGVNPEEDPNKITPQDIRSAAAEMYSSDADINDWENYVGRTAQ